MRNTKFKLLMFLGILVPWIATPVVGQDTTYVWQSADGDPFNIQGTIVLDSPSSANGSASDVVSLYISDTVDTYSWTPATGPGLYTGAPFVAFQWNPSQIISMDLSTPGPSPEFEDALFTENSDGAGSIWDFSVNQTAHAPIDESGEWVAASTVPEPSTLQLLLLGAPILIAVRRFAASAARQPRCR